MVFCNCANWIDRHPYKQYRSPRFVAVGHQQPRKRWAGKDHFIKTVCALSQFFALRSATNRSFTTHWSALYGPLVTIRFRRVHLSAKRSTSTLSIWYQRRVRQHRRRRHSAGSERPAAWCRPALFHPSVLWSLLPRGNFTGVGDMVLLRIARIGEAVVGRETSCCQLQTISCAVMAVPPDQVRPGRKMEGP